MTATTFSIGDVRERIQRGIDNKWDGIVVIALNGQLNAIPEAYLSDASYTENPVVLGGAMDDAEAVDFLAQSNDEIIAWAENMES